MQCLEVRTSMAISPHGTLAKWWICHIVRTHSVPLFFKYSFSIFLWQWSSVFFKLIFTCFLKLFSCVVVWSVFHVAAAFNGDLSAWQVGKVTNMHESTYMYTLWKIRVYFWVFLFLSSSFYICSALIFFSNPFFYHWILLCYLIWCSVLPSWCLQW